MTSMLGLFSELYSCCCQVGTNWILKPPKTSCQGRCFTQVEDGNLKVEYQQITVNEKEKKTDRDERKVFNLVGRLFDMSLEM